MTETGGEWMVETLSQYESRVTLKTLGAGPGWQQVLTPDPRRWYVRFESLTGGTTVAQIVSGQSAPSTNTGSQVPSPIEWKFRDAPSTVTGSWWAAQGVGMGIIITESIYVGVD